MFKKLSGRQAELKYTDKLGEITNLQFENNYKLKKYTNIVTRLGYEYEVIYKRKEWFKQTVRILWLVMTVGTILSLVLYDNSILYRLWDTFLLVVYTLGFRTNVITLDY